jgi:hypothetical protein
MMGGGNFNNSIATNSIIANTNTVKNSKRIISHTHLLVITQNVLFHLAASTAASPHREVVSFPAEE